jgi:outer membrane biosynthesis protein TonB
MTPFELLAMLYMMVTGFSGSGAAAEPTEPTKPTPAKPTPSKPTPTKPTPTKPTPTKPTTTVKKPSTILPASTQAPKPWPVANQPTLPTYPNGWEPYVPPPPAVVSRANQLMSELWKAGKVGVTKVEQTDGVWVTYVTFAPSKGKRGVAAYRLKAGSAAPSGQIVRA